MIMVMVMNSNMNAVGRKSGEDDIYSQENLQYLGLGFGSKDNDYFQRHLRDAFKKKKSIGRLSFEKKKKVVNFHNFGPETPPP